MKNKKGFTLVEALAVITILAVILVIATLTLKNISESSKNQTFKVLANSMQDSVREAYSKCMVDGSSKYCQDHPMLDLNEYDVITLGELVSNKFSDHFQNPWNEKEKCDLNSTVKVIRKLEGTEIDYDYEVCLVCGGKKTCEPLTERGIHKSYAAGLYDENDKMIASWDHLVKEHHLNINRGYLGLDTQDKSPDDNPMYTVLYNYYKDYKNLKLVVSDTVENIGLFAMGRVSNISTVIIPDSVKTIGWQSFYQSKIKNIIIGNGVTRIEEEAFEGCSDLTSIVIPDSVTYIGKEAFTGCTSLQSITIGKNVVEIGNGALFKCTNLASIYVDSNNKNYISINNVLYDKNQTSLIQYAVKKSESTYTIPNTVTTIGKGAFYGSKNLESVIIPDSVKSIDELAFYNVKNLVSIGNPKGINNIGKEAFRDCENLVANIEFADGIQTIPTKAFSGCKKLTGIIIPNSVVMIDAYAFENCYNLNNVEIPNSVTNIEVAAFNNCRSMTNLAIPSSVTNIGSNAFAKCYMLNNIEVDQNNQYFIAIDGVLFSKDMTNLIEYPAANSRISYTIPNGVTNIKSYAFYKAENLKTIVMPNTVSEIGQYSFYDCANLETLNISNQVVTIGTDAFESCDKLTTIIIPNSVQKIGSYAFNATGLTSATFENPNGWIGKRGSSQNATFASSSLSNPSTAALYLRKNYFQFTWTRSD